MSDWIQTFTGRKFYPLEPRAEDICLEDIAHALSMKCRYGGHCSRFYSVAEHSMMVSAFGRSEFCAWGLLHDAAEAYLADIPRPVKPDLKGWNMIEARVMDAICERFGMYPGEPPEVKEIDNRILVDESRALMPGSDAWNLPFEPLGVRLRLLSPSAAERLFLRYANAYGLT